MSKTRLLRRGGWILAAALGVSALLSFGQNSPPTAHALAQRVDRHYNQLHSLRAGFTESYEGLGMRRTESGTLLLLKPGRMKWEYSDPPGKLFLLDGKYAWFYSRGDSQVQRIPAKELDDLRSPLRFLLGHGVGEGAEQLIARRRAQRPVHAHRPTQGTGEARRASHADRNRRRNHHRHRN